ncbi:MAG: cell division protein SepF [Nitrososphaerota archaeon]|jgi:SepF-like predicted cell division protein (DUF552 family)|nr:cell division protein SepF [Nitrososphaerota archaeon]
MPPFGLFIKQNKHNQPQQTTKTTQTTFDQTNKSNTTKENQTQNMSKETQQTPNIQKNSSNTPTTTKPATIPAETIKTHTLPQTTNTACKTYLKAIPLRNLSDIDDVKNEIQNGNIIILRITPLASKSIDAVKNAVNDLYVFAESIGGDIARLGEERVVICPKNIKIWREKTPAKNETLPTTTTVA